MEYIGYTQYVADKRAVLPKYPKTPAVADVQRVAHQVWQVFAANRTNAQTVRGNIAVRGLPTVVRGALSNGTGSSE